MPRYYITQTKAEVFNPSRINDFKNYIFLELEDGLSSRKNLEAQWRRCLSMYDAVPKRVSRDVPIEGAPNIEIAVAADASDQIYSQAVDLIFSISPLLSAKPKPKFKGDNEAQALAQDIQTFAQNITTSDMLNFRPAIEDGILDDVQIGTGLYYTPWVETRKKTRSSRMIFQGPQTYSIDPADCVVPGGSRCSIQEVPFVAVRFYYTYQELVELAALHKWDLSHVSPVSDAGWVRNRRETLARDFQGQLIKGNLYAIWHIHCLFDVDGDNFAEDLLVFWNHEGRSIVKMQYNPMDNRPLAHMVYQRRPHMFYGLGVIEMIMPYEEALTEWDNFMLLNGFLANARIWAGDNLPDNFKIWPGKTVQDGTLQGIAMADIHPSAWQFHTLLSQMAYKRVGVSELASPQSMPSRVPGISMMTAVQQANRRFAPAFDGMRAAVAGSIKQALFRYQEQLLAGNKFAEAHIMNTLGFEAGRRVASTLRNEAFDEWLDVELTASSASVNQEADRQNSILLANILNSYYEKVIQLTAIAANPQTPAQVVEVAKKVADSAGKVIDRTVRTFDQVRDPGLFVIEMDEIFEEIASPENQAAQALMSVVQQIPQLEGGGGGNGGGGPKSFFEP